MQESTNKLRVFSVLQFYLFRKIPSELTGGRRCVERFETMVKGVVLHKVRYRGS